MNHRLSVSSHELWNIYKKCGPHIKGKVHVSKLYSLGRLYVDSEEEVYKIVCLLDPSRKGLLGFKEFAMGVRKILAGEHLERDSMMSPVSVSSEEPSSVVVPQQQQQHQHQRRALNGGGVPGGGSGDSEGASPHPQYELSPPDSPRPAEKSQCSSLSDGESFECYGEGGDVDLDTGPPLTTNSNSRQNDLSNQSPLNVGIKRHTWLRTSLRRSPPSHQENLPNRRWGSFRHAGKRQLGSNALASQLYRSSSFNSSGRSSTCDTADDMYSDASLEEDVLDLNHKFQLLQQQVGVLQDSATHNDERYTRAKADNAALQARIVMLEEQLRDVEMRYEQRLQDEQKRSKELVARIDREKQLQLENASIRLQAAETEAKNLREEVNRQRVKLEKLEAERNDLFDQVQDLKMDIMSTKDNETSFKEQEKKHVQEQESRNHLIEELSREVERLRAEARTPALPTTSPETLRLEELHEEMTSLRERNNQLQEQNEELQANLLSAGVEQGRLLTAGETSLAAELEAMTHDQMDSLRDETVAKIQQALKEQQDVNAQLKAYIDGILLNIVENYPQLLEVKQQKNKLTKT